MCHNPVLCITFFFFKKLKEKQCKSAFILCICIFNVFLLQKKVCSFKTNHMESTGLFFQEVFFSLSFFRNDAAQSDDDDKSQPPLADTDGGKLKQKTWALADTVASLSSLAILNQNIRLNHRVFGFSCRTQFKKFLGKSVKKAKHLAEEYGEKAVNKVKSVRDEGKMWLWIFLNVSCDRSPSFQVLCLDGKGSEQSVKCGTEPFGSINTVYHTTHFTSCLFLLLHKMVPFFILLRVCILLQI